MKTLSLLALALPFSLAQAATNVGSGGAATQTPPLPVTATTDNSVSTDVSGALVNPIPATRPMKGNPGTEAQRSTATEISFAAGATKLDDASLQKLNQVITDARRRGRIEEVKVISWGDISYPSAKEKSPRGQRDLAGERNKVIEKYLEDKNSDVRVQTYNMAERPSALSELLNSTDARTKDALETAGLAGAGVNKGSRAVVMVIVQ